MLLSLLLLLQPLAGFAGLIFLLIYLQHSVFVDKLLQYIIEAGL